MLNTSPGRHRHVLETSCAGTGPATPGRSWQFARRFIDAVSAIGYPRVHSQIFAGQPIWSSLLHQSPYLFDGCYWHGCPDHYVPSQSNREYWSTKILQNRERDDDTNRRLISEGWLPVRIWAHEDPESAADLIAKLVRDRSARGSRAWRMT